MPPQAPIMDEERASKGKIKRPEKAEIKKSGAIFCQVIKIKIIFHFIFFTTWGNQKWRGAAPIFRASAVKIRTGGKVRPKKEEIWISLVEKTIIMREAKACTVKYLIAISVKLKLMR
jgi:hypothetical protein